MRFLSSRNPGTLPLQLTPPGTLTAHERFHLVLLRSHPDTVHGFSLRKTQTSTPLTKGSYTGAGPRSSITPTGADCGYRAPLTPRLHGSGDGGIRTLVPRRANAFRVRPVMTTSIRLRLFRTVTVWCYDLNISSIRQKRCGSKCFLPQVFCTVFYQSFPTFLKWNDMLY